MWNFKFSTQKWKFCIHFFFFFRVRAECLDENPDPALFKPKPLSYDRGPDRLLSKVYWTKKYFDGNLKNKSSSFFLLINFSLFCSLGLFFMFPLLLNYILVLMTGTGMYTSIHTDAFHGRGKLHFIISFSHLIFTFCSFLSSFLFFSYSFVVGDDVFVHFRWWY